MRVSLRVVSAGATASGRLPASQRRSWPPTTPASTAPTCRSARCDHGDSALSLHAAHHLDLRRMHVQSKYAEHIASCCLHRASISDVKASGSAPRQLPRRPAAHVTGCAMNRRLSLPLLNGCSSGRVCCSISGTLSGVTGGVARLSLTEGTPPCSLTEGTPPCSGAVHGCLPDAAGPAAVADLLQNRDCEIRRHLLRALHGGRHHAGAVLRAQPRHQLRGAAGRPGGVRRGVLAVPRTPQPSRPRRRPQRRGARAACL